MVILAVFDLLNLGCLFQVSCGRPLSGYLHALEFDARPQVRIDVLPPVAVEQHFFVLLALA